MPVRQAGWLVLLFSLGVYLATTGGSMATDTMTYQVTRSLVERGEVNVPYNMLGMDAHLGVDGRYYAPFGVGQALYGVPFYVAGRFMEQVGLDVGRSETLRKAAFVAGSAVAAALAVFAMFWFAWGLAGDLRAAVETSLGAGLATLLWPYATFGFNAALGTACVLAGVYLSWAGVRRGRREMLYGAGCGLGCALLVRHEMVLLVVPVMAWIALESAPRWRVALRRGTAVAVPVLAAMAATAYYNYARFGNPLDTGYMRDQTVGFGSFPEGVWGLLASPGGSIFLYSPLALLGVPALIDLWRRDRHTAVLVGGGVLTFFVFYASQVNWDTAWSYGPRYLLPAVILLCAPIGAWSVAAPGRRRLVIAGLAVGVAVQIPGILVDFHKVAGTPEFAERTYEASRWEFGSSALAVNARASLSSVPRNVRYLTGVDEPPRLRAAADGRDPDFSHQLAFSLDFWWLYLFYLAGIPAPLAVLLGGLPLAASVLAMKRLYRLMAAGIANG
jgi:hypothetical protein